MTILEGKRVKLLVDATRYFSIHNGSDTWPLGSEGITLMTFEHPEETIVKFDIAPNVPIYVFDRDLEVLS